MQQPSQRSRPHLGSEGTRRLQLAGQSGRLVLGGSQGALQLALLRLQGLGILRGRTRQPTRLRMSGSLQQQSRLAPCGHLPSPTTS